MIELTGSKIVAVPYRNRRVLKPIMLPDGSIVEKPTQMQIQQVPRSVPMFVEVPGTGGFAGISGQFLLSSGDVAIIYGAKSSTIEPDR